MSLVLGSVLPHSLGPYLATMVVGFCVATAGHIWRTRWLVAIGIALIFLSTFLLPLALIATNDEPPPPGPGIYPPGS
ncbi:MAG: hypothetical protein QOJ38_1149 [Solirubrobacterales bacterium]|nr:hypothetical protein [Solirubrobacterales bacterium]